MEVTLDNFVDKVRSMSAKELIMAMVNGLEKEWVKVNMDTYGRSVDGICFGCAATNSICEIMQTQTHLIPYGRWARVFLYSKDTSHAEFLYELEAAFNQLRQGNITGANMYLVRIGCSLITEIKGLSLPTLHTLYFKNHLNSYIQLANQQPN